MLSLSSAIIITGSVLSYMASFRVTSFFFKRSLRIFDIVLRDAIALELGFGFFLLSASVVIAINNAARHYRLSVPGTHIWTCLQSH